MQWSLLTASLVPAEVPLLRVFTSTLQPGASSPPVPVMLLKLVQASLSAVHDMFFVAKFMKKLCSSGWLLVVRKLCSPCSWTYSLRRSSSCSPFESAMFATYACTDMSAMYCIWSLHIWLWMWDVQGCFVLELHRWKHRWKATRWQRIDKKHHDVCASFDRNTHVDICHMTTVRAWHNRCICKSTTCCVSSDAWLTCHKQANASFSPTSGYVYLEPCCHCRLLRAVRASTMQSPEIKTFAIQNQISWIDCKQIVSCRSSDGAAMCFRFRRAKPARSLTLLGSACYNLAPSQQHMTDCQARCNRLMVSRWYAWSARRFTNVNSRSLKRTYYTACAIDKKFSQWSLTHSAKFW